MADFVETVGIKDIIAATGHDSSGNFEAIYDQIYRDKQNKALDDLDAAVRAYFKSLEIPDYPTLYDYLLLSLRAKDIVVSFNWDPLLPQAYRRWRHLENALPQMLFLHGNVDIGFDLNAKVFGFLSDKPEPGIKLEPTHLLYPVEHKDYTSDPFISGIWNEATDYIQRSYLLTIYGYSAPKTDVEAKSLLLKAWKANETQQLAEIQIIDVRHREEVRKSWDDFIVGTHGGVYNDYKNSLFMQHPRRSCEAFAFATLQQRPWKPDPYPRANTLKELEEWIIPVIHEEESGKLSGNPLH